MKTSQILAATAMLTGAFASVPAKRATTISNAKTPPVSVKGNAFYTSDGKRFYIRGVDYQPGGASDAKDPIADTKHCMRDVPKFKELGINTIRIYTVDNSANHDDCMKALADAGIYLALDVNTPAYSLNRKDEASIKRSYNDVYLQSVFATVEAFAKYDNTLLFYSGNEVINDASNTFAAPYVKAVTRDIKGYMKARGLRAIPVGYSAADVEENRYETALYMNCGTDDVRGDFFAFNDYSWCSPSDIKISGWDKKVAQYKGYGIPLFLSEFGCNTNKRDFGEIAALYSTAMTGVYSGGLVYEYSQEANKYGLVELTDTSVSELPDFGTLKSAYAKTTPPTGDGGASTSKAAASQCPPKSSQWSVSTDQLPALPSKAADFFKSGAGTGPGLSNKAGSQNAGTSTTGFSADSGVPAGSGSSNSTSKSAAGTTYASFGGAAMVAVAALMV